jgi:hypothetical protein
MLHIQYLNDTAGTTISALAVASAGTVLTEGIDTSRDVTSMGLFVIHTGTISSLTREVSIDNTTFYTPYDKVSSLSVVMTTTATNSRYISLVNPDSGNICSPFTRYSVKMLSGGTLTLVYVANEV